MTKTSSEKSTDKIQISASSKRDGRGLLHKHFPLFQTTGSLAASNSVNLFGKYISSAFAVSYGTRGAKGKHGVKPDVTNAFDSVSDKQRVTLVKAVATGKHPVEVLVISNQISKPLEGGGIETNEIDDDSLGSYLEDNKVLTDDPKFSGKHNHGGNVAESTKEGSGKNVITLKEKNANLIRLVSSLATNYSIQVKQIVPFENVPSELKTKIIKNIVKRNDAKGDPCYVIVVNGDETTIAEVLAIRGLSVTRVARDGKLGGWGGNRGGEMNSLNSGVSRVIGEDDKEALNSQVGGKDDDGKVLNVHANRVARDVGLGVESRVGKDAKALNSYEKEQINALRKKLNKTETVESEDLQKPKECLSFTLYVF